MQIFENDETVSAIYQRALSLTISKEFAEYYCGKVSISTHQDSEQSNRRRELLAVEKKTHENKVIEEHGKNHFRTQVTNKFFERITTKINTEFDNQESLYTNVLHIEDDAPAILEILSVKAASINRITPLVSSLPWLTSELIHIVNKPQYKKRADVQVTKINLALSYIGLDNLKLLVPTFILKHWLPTSTASYPLMKRKLWNDSLSIALASKVLAEKMGLDGFTAFTAGMLSNTGNLAVARCIFNNYNEMHKAELRKAYEARDKRLHEVYVQMQLAPELLLEQLSSRSSKIAAELAELMRFDRLPITECLFDLAYVQDIKKMHPIAQVIIKAKAYVTFRSLGKEDLIDADETKALFSQALLTTADIALLKKSDIDHIKLNFQ